MVKHIVDIIMLFCGLFLILLAGYYAMIVNDYSRATFDLVLGLSIYYNVKE